MKNRGNKKIQNLVLGMVLGMVQGSQYWGRMFQILPPNTYSTHGNSAEEPDLLLNDLDLMPLQTLERTPYTLLPARSYSIKKLQVILGSVSCTSLFFNLKGTQERLMGVRKWKATGWAAAICFTIPSLRSFLAWSF